MLRIGMILAAGVLASAASAQQNCTEYKGGMLCSSGQVLAATAPQKPRCERYKGTYLCGPEQRQISDNVVFDCAAFFVRDCADRSNWDSNCRINPDTGVVTSRGQASVALASAGINFNAYAVTPSTAVYTIGELGEHGEEIVLATSEVAITADAPPTETRLVIQYAGSVNGAAVREARLQCTARLK